MIRFLTNIEIDKTKWNDCVNSSASATMFVDYDFLTFSVPGWCAVVKGDYDYVMPLPVRAKLFIHYVYTPFFFSRLGIFSSLPISTSLIKEFIDCIPKKYRRIDLILNESNPIENSDFEPFMMVSHCLLLDKPYSSMRASFSENTRRNIKSTAKYDLQIENNSAVKEIIDLFKAGKGKDKVVHFKEQDYDLLIRLSHWMQKKGLLTTLGARDTEGHLLAGALFLKDHNRIWFWFSGRDNRFSEKKAMFFILDYFIKENENQDIMLDFNGSRDANIARFYKSFGSERYTYPLLCIKRYSYLSPFIKLYKAFTK